METGWLLSVNNFKSALSQDLPGLPHAGREWRGADAKQQKSLRPQAAYHPREEQGQARLVVDCRDNDQVGRQFTRIRPGQPGATGDVSKAAMRELNQKFDFLASDYDNAVNSSSVDEPRNLLSEVRRRLVTEGPLHAQIPVPVLDDLYCQRRERDEGGRIKIPDESPG
jgi:hypothetical protein